MAETVNMSKHGNREAHSDRTITTIKIVYAYTTIANHGHEQCRSKQARSSRYSRKTGKRSTNGNTRCNRGEAVDRKLLNASLVQKL